jgi:hypothetical protein
MKWQRSIQGSIPQIIPTIIHCDFTEEQLRAYFTKDDTFRRNLANGTIITGVMFFIVGLAFPIHYLWFVLFGSCSLIVGGITYLTILLGINVPTDEEYDAWVEKQAKKECQKGLEEIDLEELPQEEFERILIVKGYAVPGTKDEKKYLKEDILWRIGKDGRKRYSINLYTYVIPLEYRFASLTFHVNAVNHHDHGQDVGEYFYSDMVSVRAANERELVTIDEIDYLYNTHSFLLGTNDGKGISVTIRSEPIARNPGLPEFGFVDPRVEETIRKIRRLVRSIKQRGA